MSELNKNNVPLEIDEEELELVAGGVTYPDDWNSIPIEEKRNRMLMSVRLRQLNRPCEFD